MSQEQASVTIVAAPQSWTPEPTREWLDEHIPPPGAKSLAEVGSVAAEVEVVMRCQDFFNLLPGERCPSSSDPEHSCSMSVGPSDECEAAAQTPEKQEVTKGADGSAEGDDEDEVKLTLPFEAIWDQEEELANLRKRRNESSNEPAAVLTTGDNSFSSDDGADPWCQKKHRYTQPDSEDTLSDSLQEIDLTLMTDEPTILPQGAPAPVPANRTFRKTPDRAAREAEDRRKQETKEEGVLVVQALLNSDADATVRPKATPPTRKPIKPRVLASDKVGPEELPAPDATFYCDECTNARAGSFECSTCLQTYCLACAVNFHGLGQAHHPGRPCSLVSKSDVDAQALKTHWEWYIEAYLSSVKRCMEPLVKQGVELNERAITLLTVQRVYQLLAILWKVCSSQDPADVLVTSQRAFLVSRTKGKMAGHGLCLTDGSMSLTRVANYYNASTNTVHTVWFNAL